MLEDSVIHTTTEFHLDETTLPQVEVTHYLAGQQGIAHDWYLVTIRASNAAVRWFCRNLSQVRALAPQAQIKGVC